ncbi:VOC family protein [Streptomyces sp. NPDC001212]|uniref:VOC family protein n=1 Tax=Streptomyces sp. HYC2 TaxID=2955207 RepID=UPI00247FFC2F|nr:VOC family protein [Streptomyces sp. HYC2]
MTGRARVFPDSVLFVGGDTRASRAFYTLVVNGLSDGGAPGQRIPFVPAGDVPVPPSGCWVPCFATADKEAAVRRALALGAGPAGAVLVHDRHEAVYRAPDGALFRLTDLACPSPPSRRLGDVAFFDLYTPQAEEAAAYYARALSCRVMHEPQPTPGDYRLLTSEGEPVAGVVDMLDVLPSAVPPHWIPYLRVVDLEAEVARLSDLGARVRVPATESALGPFALLADPFGVTFGLQTPASDELLMQHAAF